MSNLVSEYFDQTTIGQANQLKKGCICWAPAYYIPKYISTLELVYNDPKNEMRNRYAVARPPEHLLFNHSPVHEIHLENNEELLVIKAKTRKFVIFCEAPDYVSAKYSRLAQSCCLGLPFWTFHDDDTEEFRKRLQSLEYPWWIYVPENKKVGISEGFIRLDRLQIIPKELVKPLPVSLNEDAMYLVSEWMRFYLTGEIDAVFLEDRKVLMDAIK